MWGTGVVLLAVLSAGGSTECVAAINGESGLQRESGAGRDTMLFDESLDSFPLMQAIQKAEPQEYEAFRQTLQQGVQERLTPQQLEEVAAQFVVKMTRKHLRRAKPDLLKRYMQARHRMYEQIAAVSPETLYGYMTSGVLKSDNLPEASRGRLREIQRALFVDKDKALANLISAPPADKPLALNRDVAEKRVGEVYRKLSDAEIQASLLKDQSGVTGVNRAAYCNLLLHFYREALKFSDKDVVMVFRLIKELPEDDRATAK